LVITGLPLPQAHVTFHDLVAMTPVLVTVTVAVSPVPH
jgi:hypothetical protein